LDADALEGAALGAAHSGGIVTPSSPIDPDLATISDAWSRLPEAVRTDIVALVRAAARD
jgi:hypothetical protein